MALAKSSHSWLLRIKRNKTDLSERIFGLSGIVDSTVNELRRNQEYFFIFLE